MNREEAEVYLHVRAKKGFTFIQAVVLAECNGITDPNPYGHVPLLENDPTKPNEEYFKHVDFIFRKAAEKGMFVAVLPTWGAYTLDEEHFMFENFKLFDERNAKIYGEYLGSRFRNFDNIIWVLGGDRIPENNEKMWENMAKGLKAGDGGKHLITYHSHGYTSSSNWFHQSTWLDFNMIQSGHGRKANNNFELVQKDYHLQPIKPTIDAESNYEDGTIEAHPVNGKFSDHDSRNSANWAVFGGAFGYT